MKIEIKFKSIWGNSFLGGSNNEPLPNGGKNRKYLASWTELKKKGSYIAKDITKDTIMGVLNRLVGEQDKLYKIRQRGQLNREDYFLYDIDELLTEEDIVVEKKTTEEVTLLVNNADDSLNQNEAVGLPKILEDVYSRELFSVFFLNKKELFDFILDEKTKIQLKDYIDFNEIVDVMESDEVKNIDKDVLDLSTFNKISSKLKTVYNKREIESFDADVEKLKKEDEYKIYGSTLYCTAIYIQLDRMIKKYKLNIDEIKKLPFAGPRTNIEKVIIKGISKKTFTKKDFAEVFGMKKKKVNGSPYFIPAIGNEAPKALRKSSGKVTINLNVTKNRAEEILTAIKNARVHSFYLGKNKGLVYISEIKI